MHTTDPVTVPPELITGADDAVGMRYLTNVRNLCRVRRKILRPVRRPGLELDYDPAVRWRHLYWQPPRDSSHARRPIRLPRCPAEAQDRETPASPMSHMGQFRRIEPSTTRPLVLRSLPNWRTAAALRKAV
jgi:hypothetical protein